MSGSPDSAAAGADIAPSPPAGERRLRIQSPAAVARSNAITAAPMRTRRPSGDEARGMEHRFYREPERRERGRFAGEGKSPRRDDPAFKSVEEFHFFVDAISPFCRSRSAWLR